MSLRIPALAAGLCLAFCLALLLSPFASAQPGSGVLRVSAIPDEAPTELLRKFEPLGAYLEQTLRLKVSFVPVTDYAAVVEALAAERIDLAWLGGFTFVQARLRTGHAIPLVQREQDQAFTSTFITSREDVDSLADLQGGTFAFGSVSSTSGHLMPRHFMREQSIDPENFFSRIAFSGAHDATAAWVASGRVDAGVLNSAVWQKLRDTSPTVTGKLRVIEVTPGYHDYNWTVRGSLDEALRERIREAFLALDPEQPEHRQILDLQRASRFIPTRLENYRAIEAAARDAGLL